ncbi:hypothetical protein HYC85_016345 [Camellia sinensis]|uniref:CCHC-type domain-containing protein n=1 Tax=Camellia sinensis TaxID=4442 RepID=A0A7J7H0I4_CAMSI|nr:hypothetical protein HYC85_016345 [Camellia sinensis]
MADAIIEVEDDDDFLAQVATLEADALSSKRRKTTAATTTTSAAVTRSSINAAAAEESAEGAYTAALRGSRSLLFQQQSSRSNGGFKVLNNNNNNNNNNNMFANPGFAGGGGTVGGGGVDSCFKCGKSGHWSRDCDTNLYGVVDPSVPEKACPCGLGACIVLTANTEKNRGRQFYKCPLREENGGCGFFEWCDKNIGTDNTTVRSQTHVSNPSHASNPSIPELSCLCGAGSCLILTAKTGKNIGQQFYRCPANQGSSCGFFKWCHEHTIQGSPPVPVSTAKIYKTNETGGNNFGLRSGSSCFKCGMDGHWAKDCPTLLIQKPANQGGTTASSHACYNKPAQKKYEGELTDKSHTLLHLTIFGLLSNGRWRLVGMFNIVGKSPEFRWKFTGVLRTMSRILSEKKRIINGEIRAKKNSKTFKQIISNIDQNENYKECYKTFSPPVTKTRKLLVQNLKVFSIRTEKQKCITEKKKKKKRDRRRKADIEKRFQAKSKEREREEEEESRTFGSTQKVAGLNSVHMFHIGPIAIPDLEHFRVLLFFSLGSTFEVGISLFFFNTSRIDRHVVILYCMKIISMLDLFEIMRKNLGLVV